MGPPSMGPQISSARPGSHVKIAVTPRRTHDKCKKCGDFNFPLYVKKIEMFFWREVGCSDKERHQEYRMTTIVKSSDGSIYKGELDRFGKRTGFGTLRTPILIYGVYDPANTPRLLHWLEYKGEWREDEANGHGILRRYRGDGTNIVEHEGEWKFGKPVFEPGVSAC